jgi:hypothetical protein
MFSLVAATALIALSVGPGFGARKPTVAPSTEAKTMFEQIDEWSGDVADAAFQLGEMAKSGRDPESHLEGLAVLRDDVNNIGGELRSLEAERGSLSEWEAKALDQIMPLMQDAADNAEQAIQTYNSGRQHLWSTSYPDETARIFKDTDQVAALLRNYLRLANTREKEQRLEHRLGEASGF